MPQWPQDMLADAMAEVALLREKHQLDHKAIQLLQRRACMLASAADMGALKFQDENSTLERKLQGQLVEQECQVAASRHLWASSAMYVYRCISAWHFRACR